LADSTIYQGFINMYDPFKGLGFIRREKGKDVFFFFSELPDVGYEPTEGDKISFQIEVKPKGPRAYNIKLIDTGMTASNT